MKQPVDRKWAWAIYAAVFCFTCILSTVLREQPGFDPGSVFWQVQIPSPSIVRLHVVANSNHPVDQTFKMDTVAEVQRLLTEEWEQAGGSSYTGFLINNLPDFQKRLQQFALDSAPDNQPVSVVLDEERFPLRAYNTSVFPPGEYTALKVIIGDGRGENWWCLLFPSLCFPLAGDNACREEQVDKRVSAAEQAVQKDFKMTAAPARKAVVLERRPKNNWVRWAARFTSD
ncbi:MAG: stage II sporulation protein R [Bacillota bacterium]